jgi:hypothetical protein
MHIARVSFEKYHVIKNLQALRVFIALLSYPCSKMKDTVHYNTRLFTRSWPTIYVI